MTSERLTLEYCYIHVERQYRGNAKWKNEFGSWFKYPSVQVVIDFYDCDCAHNWIQNRWNCNMFSDMKDFKF